MIINILLLNDKQKNNDERTALCRVASATSPKPTATEKTLINIPIFIVKSLAD